MRKTVYFLSLLFLFTQLFIQGYQGFFIKHSSSGLCLQSASQYRLKGNDFATNRHDRWGPLYVVYFNNTCLHPDAQFRFFEPFSVLHNIGKNGTFLARDVNSYKQRFHIYHSPHPRVASTFIYTKQFALKQTKAGALKLNNGYCATPRIPGDASIIPTIPENGHSVYQTKDCDKEEQKFIFGSVTCDENVTTDANCHLEQVIVIQNAVYGGQSDMETCGYNENTNCTVSVTCLVIDLCQGKQTCRITVDKNLFKIDPCPGKSKYLYFEFVCANKTDVLENSPDKDVRLSSSDLPNEGFVEVAINNTRTTICDKSLDDKGRELVCRHLGYEGVKQKVSSVLVDQSNSRVLAGKIHCSDKETALSQCCITYATKDGICSSRSYVSCSICSEPLLEDRVKFPDSIFTASNSLAKHEPAKARLSSHSSWCTPSNSNHYLDIDLTRIYVINSLTTFGDSTTKNWVSSYQLRYTRDRTTWMDIKRTISGNTDGYNNAATVKLDKIVAQVLRIIPKTSNGQPCMRIQICGHRLYPDEPSDVTLTDITSSSVVLSWKSPANSGDEPVSNFHINVKRTSTLLILNIDIKSGKDNIKVQNLSPYTKYELSVAAGNAHGFGKEATVSFTTAEAVPSGSPRNVRAEILSSLFVSWIEPEKDKQNGVITNYTVCVTRSKNSDDCFRKYTTTKKNYTILNLNSTREYFMRVSASTKVGSGNLSSSQHLLTHAETFALCPCSKTALYVVIAISWIIIAIFIVVLVYVTVCRPRSLTPTTKNEVITNNDNKSFNDDIYDEPATRPEPPYSNNQNNDRDGSGNPYENTEYEKPEEEEENVYQSM